MNTDETGSAWGKAQEPCYFLALFSSEEKQLRFTKAVYEPNLAIKCVKLAKIWIWSPFLLLIPARKTAATFSTWC